MISSNETPRLAGFDISLIQKTYRFFQKLYALARRFPKQDRHTLGQKTQQLTLEVLEALFTANASYGPDRLLVLKQIDLKLKILKIIIRLSYDVRAINGRQYVALEEPLVEVGRMLGGWIKKTKEDLPHI